MICPPCRKAGALNKTNNEKPYSSTRRRRAIQWHDKCPGNERCDCQHKIGKVIRESLH